MSINRVIISGNLTRDPDLRSTQSGMEVLGLGVAVNDRRKNPVTGEYEDYPNFVDCVMFGPRARSVSAYLTKGSKVAIEGRLHWSQWERDGQKRSKLEVIVDDIEFMSARKDTAGSQPIQPQQPTRAADIPNYNPAPSPSAAPSYGYAPTTSVYDDDIPF